jgi:hypothetical protein
MAEREVAAWISYKAAEHGYPVDIGDWGGFETMDGTWAEHVARLQPRVVPYHEALRRAILARGLRRGGDWHQNARDGVPVFDDGAVGTFSFRAWGDLMAAIWGPEDGCIYGYMDFYMDSCVEDAGMTLSPPVER